MAAACAFHMHEKRVCQAPVGHFAHDLVILLINRVS